VDGRKHKASSESASAHAKGGMKWNASIRNTRKDLQSQIIWRPRRNEEGRYPVLSRCSSRTRKFIHPKTGV
jgi:hypothetical protein